MNCSQSLSDICTDLFSLISYLRDSGDTGQTEVLYGSFARFFSSIEDNARKLDIPDVDIQDAKYALVAIIDETMRWASRLEQEFFRRNIAGDEFFRRLEQIKTSKGRTGVLEIYYFCLILGFEGRYFRNPERLEEYIEELRQILGFERVEKLSPYGEKSQEVMKRRKTGIPVWVPWACAGAGVLMACVVYIVLRVRIGNWLDGFLRLIG